MKNILVAYFSYSGNTREIANQIHKSAGGDIFEIQSAKPYPDDYDAVVAQAKQELKSGHKPALKTNVENIESHDLIFIGYPNWCSTITAPVMAFLSQYDFSGKTSRGMDIIDAQNKALKAIEGIAMKQASMLSFNHVFFLIAALFLISTPLIFLINDSRREIKTDIINE